MFSLSKQQKIIRVGYVSDHVFATAVAIFAANFFGKLYTPVLIAGNAIDSHLSWLAIDKLWM